MKKFNKLKLNKFLSANKLIGVQEINGYLNKLITLDHCKELINIRQGNMQRGKILGLEVT